jgi:hypothetical protein
MRSRRPATSSVHFHSARARSAGTCARSKGASRWPQGQPNKLPQFGQSSAYGEIVLAGSGFVYGGNQSDWIAELAEDHLAGQRRALLGFVGQSALLLLRRQPILLTQIAQIFVTGMPVHVRTVTAAGTAFQSLAFPLLSNLPGGADGFRQGRTQ